MEGNSNSNSALQPATATSAAMSNTGSKGRTGGGRIKSLLLRLGGGHHGSQKTQKASQASSTAGAQQQQSTSAAAQNSKPSTSNARLHASQSTNQSQSSADKRASKQRVRQQPPSTAKAAVKGSNVAVAAPSNTKQQSQQIQQPLQHPQQNALNGVIAPAAGPGAAQQAAIRSDTASSSPSDYFGPSALGRSTSGDNDEEMDGADADASIRPITPSSIDAASSFTGSTSLHSLAPTSRTFKSFRTGHSKTSASTKPTLLSGGGASTHGPSAAAAIASAATASDSFRGGKTTGSPTTSVHQKQDASASAPSQGLTLHSDKQKEKDKAHEGASNFADDDPAVDSAGAGGAGLIPASMHDRDSNRIATSLHEAEGTVQSTSVSTRSSMEFAGTAGGPPGGLQRQQAQLPKASPLRNSFIGAPSALATGSSLAAPAEESEGASPAASHQLEQTTPREEDWVVRENGDKEQRALSTTMLPMPAVQRTDSSGIMRSSASITFSKLPPATPTSMVSTQLASPPGSPGPATAASLRERLDRNADSHIEDGPDGHNEGIYHYPRHFVADPRNNPRASSPPPDNASVLTLASSTGGRSPSIYTAASRYRDGISAASGTGGGHAGHTTSTGGPGSIVESQSGNRHSYRLNAAEDASIRAIAPSRRESTDSIGSRWSAAVLSNKEGSFVTAAPSVPGGSILAVNSAGINGTDVAADAASYKRRTPSMRTVATTASSYYAAPTHAPTEARA